MPTMYPTRYPTPVPTPLMQASIPMPTSHPTQYPTSVPTQAYKPMPTSHPTQYPSPVPTQAYKPMPTSHPTQYPSPVPTQAYKPMPTSHPTQYPTPVPTPLAQAPTPTSDPTGFPAPYPTSNPTLTPAPTPYCEIFTVEMYDSFGDGWYNTVLYVGSHTFSMETSYSTPYYYTTDYFNDTATVCLEPGTYSPYACGGMDQSEVSWSVSGVSGGADSTCVSSAGSFTVAGPPSPTPAPLGTCFSQESTVSALLPGAQSAKSLPLSKLEAGTRVLAADKNKMKVYAKVAGVHHSPASESYLEIHVVPESKGFSTPQTHVLNPYTNKFVHADHTERSSSKHLRVTTHHTFPVCHDKKNRVLPAHSLKVGDCLLTFGGRGIIKSIAPSSITKKDNTYTLVLQDNIDMVAVGGVFTRAKAEHAGLMKTGTAQGTKKLRGSAH